MIIFTKNIKYRRKTCYSIAIVEQVYSQENICVRVSCYKMSQASNLIFIKKRLQHRYFPVNIVQLQEQLFLTLPVATYWRNGKMLKRATLANSVNVQKQPLATSVKKVFLTHL